MYNLAPEVLTPTLESQLSVIPSVTGNGSFSRPSAIMPDERRLVSGQSLKVSDQQLGWNIALIS